MKPKRKQFPPNVLQICFENLKISLTEIHGKKKEHSKPSSSCLGLAQSQRQVKDFGLVER